MDITKSVKNADAWEAQLPEIKKIAHEKIDLPGSAPVDMPTIYVKKSALLDTLNYLKNTPGLEYHFLSDLTATDELPEIPRFYLVYHLFSHSKRLRVRVKSAISENEKAPSCVSIWAGANWAEREVYDMFGIEFEGHPDL